MLINTRDIKFLKIFILYIEQFKPFGCGACMVPYYLDHLWIDGYSKSSYKSNYCNSYIFQQIPTGILLSVSVEQCCNVLKLWFPRKTVG